MAENGNRDPDGPPASRTRKRREPPLIEGLAGEVPPTPETAPTPADSVPAPGAEHRDANPAPQPGEEPVLFGAGAQRDSGGRTGATQDAGPDFGTLAPSPVIDGVIDPPAGAAPATDEPDGAAERLASTLGPAEPQASAPPAAKRASFWTPATGLLTVLVLGLLGTVAWLLATEDQRSRSGELAQSIDALRGRIATLEARPSASADDLAALGSKFDTLTESAGTTGTHLAEDARRLDALDEQIKAVRAEVAGLRTAAASAPAPATSEPQAPPVAAAPDESALAGRIEEVERRVVELADRPAPAASATVDLGPVEARLAQLEHQVAALAGRPAPTPPPPIDLGPIESRVADVDGRLAALAAQTNAVRASVAALPKVDVTPLEAATSALGARLAADEAASAAPKPQDPVLVGRIDASAAATSATARAVVSGDVLAALDAGRAFAPELDALRSLGADADTLGPLVRLAPGGAPTLAALRQEWGRDIEAATTALAKPDASAGILDRFASGARTLVQVRRMGDAAEAQAGDPGQVDAALARNDLAGALAAWSALPEPLRQGTRAWALSAQTRLDGERAAQAIRAQAVSALAKAKG